jgi:hypothetical protein
MQRSDEIRLGGIKHSRSGALSFLLQLLYKLAVGGHLLN